MTPLWQVQLLGGAQAHMGDRTLTRFRTHKTGALFFYLAFYREQAHSREVLAELIWPDNEAEAQRSSLRVALHSLRGQLEPPGIPQGSVLFAPRGQAQLSPQAVMTDVAAFEAQVRVAEQATDPGARVAALTMALQQARGELLPGYYDAWILPERERLDGMRLSLLQQLMEIMQQAGEWNHAIAYAQQAAALAPLQEEPHTALIRLYLAANRRVEALEQYHELERMLADQLGLTPTAETCALVEPLGVGKARPPAKKRPRPPDSLPTSDARPGAIPLSSAVCLTPSPRPAVSFSPLPLPYNRLFGREEALARLQALLAPRSESGGSGPRLVTLTGTGGAGKTRLAMEAASTLQAPYRDRIWFVPLSDVSEAGQIARAIADAMCLARLQDVPLLEQVTTALATDPALLVLDNLEHLLGASDTASEEEPTDEAADLVYHLIQGAPRLRCLLTSRQRLDLAGEQVLPVPPLPVPSVRPKRAPSEAEQGNGKTATDSTENPLSPAELLAFPGVQLFVNRAQNVRPDFQVTPRNAEAIAGICNCLDGIPLALELVAAWAQTQTVAQMLASLTEGFQLLTSRRRDLPPRHRSLRAAMEWGFRLLRPELKRYYARLSVFRGGWLLDAAALVCCPPIADEEVAEGRARENADSETEAGADRALLWQEELCGLSLAIAEEREGAMRYRMLETLRSYAEEQLAPDERMSLRQRHARYFADLSEKAGPHLIGTEQVPWLNRLEAEQENIRYALAWALECEPETALRLSAALPPFWEMRGHVSEGRRSLAAALAKAESAPSALRSKALNGAGNLAWVQGDVLAADGYHREALTIRRAQGDEQRIAYSLNNLGLVAWHQGQYERARAYFEESLALKEALGDAQGAAATWSNLGLVARAVGNYAKARELCERSVRLLRSLGEKRVMAFALNNLASVAQNQQEVALAGALLRESLHIRQELGDRRGLAYTLENMAALALAQQQGLAAARLLGAAATLRATTLSPLPPFERLEQEKTLAAVQAALAPEAFVAAWNVGRALSLDQALAYANEVMPLSE